MNTVSLHLNNWLYSIRTLKFFYQMSWIFKFGILGAIFLGFYLNFSGAIILFGQMFVARIVIGPLVVGLLISIYLALTKRKAAIAPVMLASILPTSFFTEFGIQMDFYILFYFLLSYIEKSHRVKVVSIISGFSKEYSPLYKKRLENKGKYPEYKNAFFLANSIDSNEIHLVKEVLIEEKGANSIPQKTMIRTFKIKGIYEKTKVKDQLYTMPVRHGLFRKTLI